MFKKKIWRMLDLRQKINFPLYYPTEPIEDRISLIDLIISGFKDEQMTVYNPDEGDEFTTVLPYEEIEKNFDAGLDTIDQEDPETGEIIKKVIKKPMRTSEVKRYMMKEIWYFDKQRSMLQVRIIGLCPIRMYTKGADEGGDESAVFTQKQVLWVYYPAFRPLFATHVVFNTQNDAERRTFEDIFSMRRFESYIYRKTNVYDNRRIGSYTKGLDSILESDKITEWMRNWEHDLWEY
jgi:gliding motility associated protien GldN